MYFVRGGGGAVCLMGIWVHALYRPGRFAFPPALTATAGARDGWECRSCSSQVCLAFLRHQEGMQLSVLSTAPGRLWAGKEEQVPLATHSV